MPHPFLHAPHSDSLLVPGKSWVSGLSPLPWAESIAGAALALMRMGGPLLL